jgi:hypothetical protein
MAAPGSFMRRFSAESSAEKDSLKYFCIYAAASPVSTLIGYKAFGFLGKLGYFSYGLDSCFSFERACALHETIGGIAFVLAAGFAGYALSSFLIFSLLRAAFGRKKSFLGFMRAGEEGLFLCAISYIPLLFLMQTPAMFFFGLLVLLLIYALFVVQAVLELKRWLAFARGE